jgi:hypothetical protein
MVYGKLDYGSEDTRFKVWAQAALATRKYRATYVCAALRKRPEPPQFGDILFGIRHYRGQWKRRCGRVFAFYYVSAKSAATGKPIKSQQLLDMLAQSKYTM